MGKYLQDFRYDIDNELTTFSEVQKNAQRSCSLISFLYNFYLPRKIVAGDNIWRINVILTLDKNKDQTFRDFGSFESYLYYDCKNLVGLEIIEQKTILLELFYKGLCLCFKNENPFLSSLKNIHAKILNDNIIYNDYYKDNKKSPNKEFSAQMKGFYSENYDERKLYLVVFDNENNEIKSILVGNYNFQAFDRIKWADNKTVFVYHVNNIQSYKRKKVAEDYYSIDIENQSVTYNPVTKESMFDYGVQLLTETNEFDKAMKYLLRVREFGHGKVENILRNLEINPNLRDKSILLQEPKRK